MTIPYEVLCHQSDPQWLQLRQPGIGASEIAIVLGMNPWKSPLALYAEKVNPIVEQEDREMFELAHEIEPLIAQRFAMKTGLGVEPDGRLLRSKDHSWMLATPDYQYFDSITNETLLKDITVILENPHPLELKSSGELKESDWVNGCPEYYLPQVNQQMLVLGVDRAAIAVRFGNKKQMHAFVDRDETLCRKIIYAGEKFWQMVQDKNPPAPDGTDSSKQALNALYPQDSGEEIVLDASLEEVAEKLIELKEARKMTEAAILEAENWIKAALGNATVGRLQAGTFSWKLQERKEHLVAASSSRVLRYSPNKSEE
jgi:putative phage-type endonuclease